MFLDIEMRRSKSNAKIIDAKVIKSSSRQAPKIFPKYEMMSIDIILPYAIHRFPFSYISDNCLANGFLEFLSFQFASQSILF